MIRKILKYFFAAVAALIFVLALYLVGPGLGRRWAIYPAFDKQVKSFQSKRVEPPSLTPLNTYRGLMHAHSYWSHDSEGTLSDIIPAAKSRGIDFIFLTDHAHGNLDTFPRGYQGYYDGVLIEAGTERQGFCAWPLDSVVIDWTPNRDTVAKAVVSGGGMIFYAHSEEQHNWESPYYQGMEIYNIHTDTKDESLVPMIFNLLVNKDKYRAWAMRELFDEQTSILKHWDALNSKRKIVGFSAVDAHENQNIRARYLEDGRVEWVGPNAKPFDTVELSFLNRWLFDSADASGWIFKLMIDTYETSFDFVTNYVVTDTLTVPSLASAMKNGNLFIAFKNLGDAQGFMFCSRGSDKRVSGILGDSVSMDEAKSLYAVSPLPGEFRLIHDGALIAKSSGNVYDYEWTGPTTKGIYRVEVHVQLGDQVVPWVYTNPIYVY